MVDETRSLPSDDSPEDETLSQSEQTGQAESNIKPGSLIAGRYRLTKAIGEGGMGAVWLAQQNTPVKRQVAVKLIKPGMDSHQVLARFQAERQALAMMDHPNIAKVLDGGLTDQDRPFFAMEYVEGIPITKYCDEKRMSVKDRLEIFTKVCRAVQHAHQKGIIHRDLKPGNILVASNDSGHDVKVIDFGLAKAIHESLTDQTLFTAQGMVLGTPLYMSPEQAASNSDIDTRTDVYSLGVILYELLTGATPIDRQEIRKLAIAEVARVIRDVEPPKPSSRISTIESLPSVAAMRNAAPTTLRRRVSGDLDWVVMKAIEKDRNRRYETANGLASDILRHLANEPVVAGPPSARYRMQKFVKRNKVIVVAASIVFLVLIAGVTGTSIGMYSALKAQNRAETAIKQKDEALKETRQTIDQYVETVQNEELLKEPRFKPVLKELLKDALEHYQRFIRDHEHDPAQLSSLSDVVNRVASISHESGTRTEALDAFKQVISIRERLVDTEPTKKNRFNLATSLSNIATIQGGLGNNEAAMESLKRSESILRELIQEYPDDVELKNGLASVFMTTGMRHRSRGEIEKAIETTKFALNLRQQIVKSELANVEDRKRLANTYLNLAVMTESSDDRETAIEYYKDALSVQEELVANDPDNSEYLEFLSGSLFNIGTYYHKDKQFELSLEYQLRALEIRKRLAAENPTVSELQVDVSDSHNNLGLTYKQLGDVEKALDSMQASLAILESIAKEDPDNVEYQISLGGGYVNLASFLIKNGRFHDANDWSGKGTEILAKAVESNPAHPKARNFLLTAHNMNARSLEQLARYSEAAAEYQQMLDLNTDERWNEPLIQLREKMKAKAEAKDQSQTEK